MSCTDCYTSIDFGEKYCTKCIAKSFCTLCNRHTDKVGPLRTKLDEKCCDECYSKTSTPTVVKKNSTETLTTLIEENPYYLTDIINGWWTDGYRYYFAIQNQIYAAYDIPREYDEFKRAITFDEIDAEVCGYIRGTTIFWS
jgi:hypothetical protein